MLADLDRTLGDLEQGRIDRRTALRRVAGVLFSAAAAGTLFSAEEPAAASTFEATALNHLALRVSDVARSREFYGKHLGIRPVRDDGTRCFLGCGENFVALFPAEKPGMDHYCYTIKDYDPDRAVETLKAEGLSPVRHDNRVYFEDPDGLTVQLAGKWTAWPGPAPR